MVKPYRSDIRMAYEYIKVKYGWHKSDIRMTYDYIRVTCGWHTSTYEWHTDDMRVHTFNTLSVDKVSTRSNRPEVFCKKYVLRNFAKFTGKYLCQSLFFGLKPATLSKKRLWLRCIPVNFVKFLRTTFFYRAPPVTASLNVISFLQDIKQNVLLSSYLDNRWRHKL